MTAKQFFKSTAFKCIVALLITLLVSGVFLTVMYGFMEVTDAERLGRALNKVYGKGVKTADNVIEIEYTEDEGAYGNANILVAYLDDDGNCLVKSKGAGGFGGTVTCWVLVEIEGEDAAKAISKVKKVVIEGSDGETFLNKINFLDKFGETEYTDGMDYNASNGFVTTGASMSSGAIDNAVNGAVSFVTKVVLNVEGGSSNE